VETINHERQCGDEDCGSEAMNEIIERTYRREERSRPGKRGCDDAGCECGNKDHDRLPLERRDDPDGEEGEDEREDVENTSRDCRAVHGPSPADPMQGYSSLSIKTTPADSTGRSISSGHRANKEEEAKFMEWDNFVQVRSFRPRSETSRLFGWEKQKQVSILKLDFFEKAATSVNCHPNAEILCADDLSKSFEFVFFIS
jgi:hypothetical protein